MSEKTSGKALPDHDTYVKNRCSHSLDELARYGDEWVAWSADGKTVVDHDRDPLVLTARIQAAGIDSEDVRLEWIPPGGEVDTFL
jgi:hypothetical protein